MSGDIALGEVLRTRRVLFPAVIKDLKLSWQWIQPLKTFQYLFPSSINTVRKLNLARERSEPKAIALRCINRPAVINLMNKIQKLQNLRKIRKIAKLLDTAIGIPGTKFRIGLDPILGLIPGGGDLITAAISAYMIYLAARFGLSKKELNKMIANIAIETAIGSIPIAGDIFDAYFKANIRNLEILEKHIAESEELNEDLVEENKELIVG